MAELRYRSVREHLILEQVAVDFLHHQCGHLRLKVSHPLVHLQLICGLLRARVVDYQLPLQILNLLLKPSDLILFEEFKLAFLVNS
jgi:hypothetical protein